MIEKKEFAVIVFDPEYKNFIICIAILNINLNNNMYLLKKAQIAHLNVNKVFIKVFSKYTNFANIFSPKLAIKVFKYMRINNQAIKLIDD